MRRESIETANSRRKFTFHPIWSFFAWQSGRDYRQWRLKSRIFWRKDTYREGGFEERRRTMTQFDEGLPPPFEIVEPADWRAPIIFNSPHSGSVYPAEFLKISRIDLAGLRRSEDSFMDELIAGLSDLGFPTVSVNFPRSYVDVNREPYELDPRMFSGRLAELCQYALDAGCRRARHHPARGRRRPGNLQRTHRGR